MSSWRKIKKKVLHNSAVICTCMYMVEVHVQHISQRGWQRVYKYPPERLQLMSQPFIYPS